VRRPAAVLYHHNAEPEHAVCQAGVSGLLDSLDPEQQTGVEKELEPSRRASAH
jgi:hypothetical protein